MIKSWTDFGKGDYGDIGGWRAPEGSFSGVNMKVDRDGSICPRKGAVSLALTSLSGSAADPFAIDANLDVFSGVPRIYVLFGGAIGAYFTSEAAVASAWTNYTNGATYYVQTYTPHLASLPGFTYFEELSDPDDAARHRLIEVNHNANTQTAIGSTDTHKGGRLALYLDRIYKEIDHQDYLGAVKYSAGPDPDTLAFDFGTFSATAPGAEGTTDAGWITVGSKARISRFLAWRDSLLFFKDTEVWQLRGVPSPSMILRRLCSLDLLGGAGAGEYIPHAQQVMVLSDNSIAIAPNKGYRPVFFDGMQGRQVEHVNLGRQGRHLVAPFRDGSAGAVFFDALLPSGSGTGYDWVFNGKTWWKWLLTRPSIPTPSGTMSIWPRQGIVQRAYGTDHFFWVEKVTGGTVNAFRLPLTTDGPGLNNSPYEQPGDGSTTALNAWLTFPVEEAPPGKTIRLQKIVIIAKKWRTGGASTNHVDLTVGHYNRYRVAQADSTTVSWDEANASAGAATGDSTSQTIELTPGNNTDACALEVRLTNIRGISIRSVHLEYEVL